MPRLNVVAAALIAAIAVAGLVTYWHKEDTLTIAIHQGVEGVALKVLAGAYSSENHVTVEVVELPYDALYNAEMDDVTGKREPRFDVIMADDPWLPALIGEDMPGEVPTRLATVFDAAGCVKAAIPDFLPTTLLVSLHPLDPKVSAWRSTGRLPQSFDCHDAFHALPLVGNAQLFVMRGRSTEPPSWEQINGKTRPADGGYVMRVGAGNSVVADFMPLLWNLSRRQPAAVPAALERPPGGDIGVAVDEGMRDAVRFLKELGAQPAAPRGPVSTDDFDLTIHVLRGDASMSIEWSAWVMAMWKLPEPYNRRSLRRDAERDPDALRVTQVPGGQPALGAWLLAVPARSPRIERARDFIAYATGVEGMKLAALQGNPPSRSSVLNDPALKLLFPSFPQQLASLTIARPRPRTPYWRGVEQVLGGCLAAVYAGAIDDTTAMTRIAQGLEPLVEAQQKVDAKRLEQASAKTADTKAQVRQEIRTLLDASVDSFTCDPGTSNY